jgi:uncharacterized protein with HEPN domain
MPRDPAKNPLDDRIRVQHMLEAARDVAALAAGRSLDDLRTSMPVRRAMVNAIQEIGEAAAKVSPLGRARIPGVPWGVVVGMRNRLVHGYDEINIEVVWKVATEEVHGLITALESACASWPLSEPGREY